MLYELKIFVNIVVNIFVRRVVWADADANVCRRQKREPLKCGRKSGAAARGQKNFGNPLRPCYCDAQLYICAAPKKVPRIVHLGQEWQGLCVYGNIWLGHGPKKHI